MNLCVILVRPNVILSVISVVIGRMHLLRQTPQRQILAQEMKQKLSFSHPLATVPALPGHFLVNRGLVLVLNIYKDQLVKIDDCNTFDIFVFCKLACK